MQDGGAGPGGASGREARPRRPLSPGTAGCASRNPLRADGAAPPGAPEPLGARGRANEAARAEPVPGHSGRTPGPPPFGSGGWGAGRRPGTSPPRRSAPSSPLRAWGEGTIPIASLHRCVPSAPAPEPRTVPGRARRPGALGRGARTPPLSPAAPFPPEPALRRRLQSLSPARASVCPSAKWGERRAGRRLPRARAWGPPGPHGPVPAQRGLQGPGGRDPGAGKRVCPSRPGGLPEAVDGAGRRMRPQLFARVFLENVSFPVATLAPELRSL